MIQGLKEKVDMVNEHVGTLRTRNSIFFLLYIFPILELHMGSYSMYPFVPDFSLGKFSSIHLLLCGK